MAPSGPGHALTAQPQLATRRGSRRDARPGRAGERLDFDGGPEGRLPRGDRNVDVDVATLHPESRMRLESHPQEQVAGGTVADAPAPLAGEPDALAVPHASGDVDVVVAAVAERALRPPPGGGPPQATA